MVLHPLLSPAAKFDAALLRHQAGEFAQAERGYLAVLQAEPHHAPANHNLGALFVQQGKIAEGLRYLLAALEAEPACAQYWTSYIDALYRAGQFKDAREVLATARRQGLAGERVDELAARLAASEPAIVAKRRGKAPAADQIDALLALFGEGRLEQAGLAAHAMTVRYPQHGLGWKVLGAVYKLAGLDAEALFPMQNAAQLSPNDAEAHYNLGLVLQDLGRLHEAEACYRRTIRIAPLFFQAHCSLGAMLLRRGRLRDAEASFRKAIRINPDYTDAHNNIGNALKQQGHLIDATGCYLSALAIDPDYAPALSNLGLVYEEMGRLEDAVACFEKLLKLAPDAVDAHCSLGNLCYKLGRLEDAEASFRQALKIRPDLADLHFNLANTLLDLDKTFDAEVCYRQAILLRPDYAEAHYNLGAYLMRSKWMDEAEVSFRNALQCRPDYVEVYCNLGVLLQVVGRMEEGIACFQRVAQLKPDSADVYNDLGNVQRDSGRHEDAKTSYRRALELDPAHATAHSNLIFALDLVDDVSIEEMQAERRNWGEMHAARHNFTHANTPDPDRRLRIGYVATDFRTNSAPTVYGAMLFEYDRSRFEVFAYSNETKSTALTERFKRNVTGWRDIFGMPDDEVADLIRADKIDILVDLAGHSGRNRLTVFAMKPAPIQITAWGYSTGTGIRAIDVLFSDPVLIPPDEKDLYAEQVRYLPIFFSYYPCQSPPPVGPLPALQNGYVTFGTFTRMEKVTDETYRAWAAVLLAVPGSRMLLKNHEMKHAEARARVTERFTRFGVAPERLLFMEWTPWEAHMDAFNRVDIALDTFPQGGGVTSLEGISMGVPLITLCWPTFAGRTGKSILTALGLSDWVADTTEQFVEIARRKAQDIDELARLRSQLRGRLKSSVVGDTKAYARVVEGEYLKLWREWCEKQSSDEVVADAC